MEVRSLYRPGVQDSEVGNVQMSARVCVVRRRRCHKERLACVRVRVLAATREATVVHVYNTGMISKRVHLYRDKQRLSRSTAGGAI